MSTTADRCYTRAEYLAFERASEEKHEFFEGVIFAMARRSASHCLVAGNLASELIAALRESQCRVFGSGLRISCPSGLYTYPDVSVVCGKPKCEDEEQDVLLNPQVLVEVLAPSTHHYDRGGKFEHFQRIPTLQEYLLVSPDRVCLQHYARQQDADHWMVTFISNLQGVVEFPALKCEIPVAEIYAKVDLTTEAPFDHDRKGIVVQPPQS